MRRLVLRRPLLATAIAVSLGVAALAAGCSDDEAAPAETGGAGSAGTGGTTDAGGDATDAPAEAGPWSPVESVPLSDTIAVPGLSAPVDVVRDAWGVPHIYGTSSPDVAFAQGYLMAHDRLPQMDLARHNADGTLGLLVGTLSPAVLDTDIKMRMHHMRATAQQAFDALKASSDPADGDLVKFLGRFADGVNAYIADLQAGKYTLPKDLALFYPPKAALPWTEVDSLLLGQLQSFMLAYDASSDILRTLLDTASQAAFDSSSDPKLALRTGLNDDLQILAPLDPTYTIDGWTGMNGDTSTAMRTRGAAGSMLALLEADHASVRDIGDDHTVHPSRGSNNWIVGPSLSATGNVMVANDTHLGLSNPATFWLNHLAVRDDAKPLDVMGVAFPGIPGVVLGMNRHIAWGATVNVIDVTDVYAETIVTCDGSSDPCVVFGGAKVPLVPRVEKFDVGLYGTVNSSFTVTMYDVPHHGPIIPRPAKTHDGIEALGSSELSVKYTGYEPAQLLRAIYGVDIASTMQEAVASLDRDFAYGGQNWVVGDDQGHFGWTETVRTPRRAPGHAPWKVLPGDGSAEWGPDMDPKYIPHAYDPTKGFLATANNDPIGVTDDGDPFFGEPVVDGAPLYLGADYDPGTRVGRITKRIEALANGGSGKLTLDDLQSIQADAKTEWGEALAPTLVATAQALGEEIAQPGTHPELSSIAAGASATAKGLVPTVLGWVQGWTFDTPSGAAEENPSPAEIADAQAALVSASWIAHFAHATLDDEIAAMGSGVAVGDGYREKLLVRASTHPELLKSGIDPTTNDPAVFDDLATPEVESKLATSAKALVKTLDDLAATLGADATTWRWGQVHTLTLEFLTPIAALAVPPPTDPTYPNGFPRHGDDGTVDVGHHGLSTTDFTYSEGPAIRFVCELTKNGPRGRNALPGGEIFDPKSPHYRDQMELWRKNQTFDLAFADADVLASANDEYAKNGLGRIRFEPK